ncbi:aminotransferase class I/II-fold pyridoxal phosphate-dependent enzyme [Moorella sp. E306M]|uniref:methionine gamma-lyase family protein n=1 Tax=Moorella sp. E306M TaxID=2572683 RepID=UPI0010FFAB77|nr:methionine gamma-lyase family protein [Moorella sp. E306M]GEA19817.1 aluminum resistance protein [Moorella sp. E306M]
MDWYKDISRFFPVAPWLVEKLEEAENNSREAIAAVNAVSDRNHFKVLRAFQKHEVNEYHFQDSTGYGYGDLGRSTLERLFASIFGGNAALVRPQIVSGTHALTLALSALLRPGDTLLSACGRPYDTLATVIGLVPRVAGSLREWGIKYAEVALDTRGRPDLVKIGEAVTSLRPRLCLIQRSRGYSLRPSLGIEEIARIVGTIKEANRESVCLVDNCYGELVEDKEPGEVGADLVVGSLIKNPGGGLAPGGGYIVGREDLVEVVAARLTAPGLGGELGAFTEKRLYYQGLYLAPLVVREALTGAIVAAAFFRDLGFNVDPLPGERRRDIVQCIILEKKEALLAFCQGLQRGSPVEAGTLPEPALLPGYKDEVIMAGGTFIQGSSIELSADGPLRPPYAVFLQGGQTYPYTRIALLMAAQELINRGLLQEKRR